ncbi:4'-phosphopantetheinyl transferase superfamily protein [Streptomyces sp. NPDC050147]|uniref:4'-phosphopantetheinyl transferase family protein n=1 Tax=Streptomyces sp. NPDC050147 TaxID=3155513 RepID=UPI00343323F5
MQPLHNHGPADSWERARRDIACHGTAVIWSPVKNWLPPDLADPDLVAALGPDHRRVAQMALPQLRERFVASRLFLKSAAGAVLGVSLEDLELAYKPGGRPYLRGIDQLDISLSHTEELLVVGLTRHRRVGVDTEFKDRQMLALGTERQVCTPYELQALAGIEEEHRNGELVRLWTLKEAYSKAIGQGLRFRFCEFGFTARDEQVQLQRPDGSPGTGGEWAFYSWIVADRYTVSAAVHDPGLSGARTAGPGAGLLPALSAPVQNSRSH